jgi:hypothetical protein
MNTATSQCLQVRRNSNLQCTKFTMRTIIAILALITLPSISKGQAGRTISEVCNQVSTQWKLDSNACKGRRLELSRLFSNARSDSITKSFLFIALGKPNRVQKFYVGYPYNKNYVEYIYYIYKDDCPKIKVAGASIGFVFDESETYFIKIEDHDYCG